MVSNSDIRCPDCRRKLAEVDKNGYIVTRHKIGLSKDRFGVMATNGEAVFECTCNFTGLYIINHGWETTVTCG